MKNHASVRWILILSLHAPLDTPTVLLLGDLNWRLRLQPDDILGRVAASATECQAKVEGGANVKLPPDVAEAARDRGWRYVCICVCGVGWAGITRAHILVVLELNNTRGSIIDDTHRGLLYRRLWAGADSTAYEHGLEDTHLESLQEVRCHIGGD